MNKLKEGSSASHFKTILISSRNFQSFASFLISKKSSYFFTIAKNSDAWFVHFITHALKSLL